MTKEQAIEQLKDLKADRKSFIQNEKEHDEVFLDDIKAIETILSMLEEKDKIIETLTQQRDYYKERYNEFNKAFIKMKN